MNWWLLDLPFPHEAITALYVVTLAAGYLCLLMAGLWISRLYRHNLMEDVFNMENESFMQETRLMENEYSVNLPTRFQYGGKLNDGWINVVNPFRATIVLGTPGHTISSILPLLAEIFLSPIHNDSYRMH